MSFYPFNPNLGQKIQGEAGVVPFDRGFVGHYRIAPAAISAVAVLAATALTTGVQTITAGITNPDFPRTVTVKGNAAGIAGNVVVTGKNAAGVTITDTIALNAATEVEGVKAFKEVTSIQLPIKTNGSGDTVSIGMAKKFGMPAILANAACLLVKLFDGSADTGSLTVDSDEVEKNLFALNGTPNGAKVMDLFFIV